MFNLLSLIVSAPKDAKHTETWFFPDGKTLFLSVQHPG
jgi:secreted PhoX family phosphatase